LPIVLASTSPIRRHMLEAAGVEHECAAPGIDENPYKERHAEAAALVLALGSAKALAVSGSRPDAWVIGSDSVVTVPGAGRCDKPRDRDHAAEQLRLFSGQAMTLTSGVALARGANIEWQCAESARLQVRDLSDAFIADYLDAEWPEVGYTVGVFRLEGRGVQLFESIEGDHFTILGMPLLPLLGALRERGLIAA